MHVHAYDLVLLLFLQLYVTATRLQGRVHVAGDKSLDEVVFVPDVGMLQPASRPAVHARPAVYVPEHLRTGPVAVRLSAFQAHAVGPQMMAPPPDELPRTDEPPRTRALPPRMAQPAVGASEPSIRIERLPADTSRFAPKNAQRLARFMMSATYGASRPLSVSWAQRGILDAVAEFDLFERLAFYEQAYAAGRPQGAILVAKSDDGSLCGFVDVGLHLWLPKDRAFRLPMSPDLQRLVKTGVGAEGQASPGVELRPYVSNLVVDPSMRLSGVGRTLMNACEAEAHRWLESCRVAGAAPCENLWLEVTSTNEGALSFYSKLGFESQGRTRGPELQREGELFRMVEVDRLMLRKAME